MAKKDTKKKHVVIVYSTETCPWCDKAKDFLKHHRVPFQDMDVGLDKKAAQEMMKKSGQMGVPVIEIGGTIIVGFDQDMLKKRLGIT